MLRAFVARRPNALLPRLCNQSQVSLRYFGTQSKQEEGSTDSSQVSPNAPETETSSSNGSADAAAEQLPPVAQLEQQLLDKEAELSALNDRVLRVLAEMENVRTIARRDVENARRYAMLPFAKALLSVADNLGLALKAVPQDALADPAHVQLKGLYVGVDATEKELLKVFSQHGIIRFGEIGERFDPNKYQAVFEAPSGEHEPGTVIDVTKLGYTIGDRILRPAEVGVSKAP